MSSCKFYYDYILAPKKRKKKVLAKTTQKERQGYGR